MSFARVRHDRSLRLVLVGAGGMGREWARTIAADPDVQLAAWVDLEPERARQSAAELGLTHVPVASTLDGALAAVAPVDGSPAGVRGVDAVVDVTVPQAHHEVTLQALRAGLPVLGEKPLADTMEQARDMVQAADAAGQLFMVSQSRRYDDNLRAYKRALSQLGPVGILTAQFFLGPRFGGFRDEMADPLLLDMAIHAFDTARYLSGADPVSLWCDSFNPAWSWYAGDAAAVASVQLADGSRFVWTGAWCADGLPTSWNAQWRAVGPNGSASWDGEQRVELDLTSDATPATATEGGTGIAGALAEFVAALRAGQSPMGECHDNIRSLAMVHAAVRSAREGVRVSVQEVLDGAGA